VRRSTIKHTVSIAVTAIILALPFSQVSAFTMDEMVNDYTASTVTPNSRISLDGRRGFMSGGGLRVRFANKPIPSLYNITLPSFSAGCNGMDMNLGSLSWISADEFMDAARAMASPGVLVYALSLALNQMCGPCAQKMSELQAQLNKYSSMLKQSCESSGQWLYENSGAKQRVDNMERNLWEVAVAATGNDAAETKGNATQDVLDAGGQDIISGNVVWEHLDGMTIGGWLAATAGENVARELIMTLSGTDILDATGASNEDEIEPNPLLARPISLTDFIKGGEITGLKCNNYTDCLDVEVDGVLFTLDPMVDTFMAFLDPDQPDSIVTKFAIHYDDIELTPPETAFLQAAQRHADVQKYIHSLAMTGNRMPRKTAEIISEMMAIDIALTFMIEYVQTAVIVLSNIDNKAAIAPMNQFTLTHMYREEAEMLRDDLIKRLETDANLSTTMKNAMDL